MIGTRYEEYKNFTDGLPFVLNENISRSPFNFSEKQNWHENIEIQLCTEGNGMILLDSKKYSFAKDDIAIIDSGAIHYTYSDSSITYSCLIISTEFCKQMGIDCYSLSFLPIVRNERILTLFAKMIEVYKKAEPLRIARLNNLLLEILIEISSIAAFSKKPVPAEQKGLRAVKKTILFIRENYNTKISLEQISKYVLLDKYALCKEFKKYTGQTIFENINHYRCIKAIELLGSGKTVSETAYLCGFENKSFFTKMFKKHIGMTPSEYKKAL